MIWCWVHGDLMLDSWWSDVGFVVIYCWVCGDELLAEFLFVFLGVHEVAALSFTSSFATSSAEATAVEIGYGGRRIFRPHRASRSPTDSF